MINGSITYQQIYVNSVDRYSSLRTRLKSFPICISLEPNGACVISPPPGRPPGRGR
ncbi:unnamed protein product [Penicillium nalgiovense]|nr:unnamed protein product [Penicillium nalgiovense]